MIQFRFNGYSLSPFWGHPVWLAGTINEGGWEIKRVDVYRLEADTVTVMSPGCNTMPLPTYMESTLKLV